MLAVEVMDAVLLTVLEKEVETVADGLQLTAV